MELRTIGGDHVDVANRMTGFFLMGLDKCVVLSSHVLLAIYICESVLGVVILLVEDEPSWGFRETVDEGEEEDRVDLHGNDWDAPS